MKTITLKQLNELAVSVFGHEYVEVDRPSYYDQNKPNAKFALFVAHLDNEGSPRADLNWKQIQFNSKNDVNQYLLAH